MPVEAAIWDLHGDRLGTRTEARPGARSPEQESARRVAAVRLLDAALVVLAATGQLVGVAEDVLREQRQQLAAQTGDAGGDTPAAPDTTRPQRIDLTY